MIELDRHSRQRTLPEVGDLGQERIARLPALIAGRDGAMVELSYLERAGVLSVAMRPDAEPEPFPHAGWFRFDSSKRSAAGAWRALAKLRRALELPSP